MLATPWSTSWIVPRCSTTSTRSGSSGSELTKTGAVKVPTGSRRTAALAPAGAIEASNSIPARSPLRTGPF